MEEIQQLQALLYLTRYKPLDCVTLQLLEGRGDTVQQLQALLYLARYKPLDSVTLQLLEVEGDTAAAGSPVSRQVQTVSEKHLCYCLSCTSTYSNQVKLYLARWLILRFVVLQRISV